MAVESKLEEFLKIRRGAVEFLLALDKPEVTLLAYELRELLWNERVEHLRGTVSAAKQEMQAVKDTRFKSWWGQ